MARAVRISAGSVKFLFRVIILLSYGMTGYIVPELMIHEKRFIVLMPEPGK